MATGKYKNPVDPATGRPKRGRPPKVKPVDVLNPEPQEMAFGLRKPSLQEPVEVSHLDPKEDQSTELGEQWRSRFRGTSMLDVPQEIQAQYPDGSFCWARDTKEGVSIYRSRYGYEPVQTAEPMPGQTDTCFRFGDTILMVRPKKLKQIHDQVRMEDALRAAGDHTMEAVAAEREATNEARAKGLRVGFTNETHTESGPRDYDPEAAQELSKMQSRPKGAAGRGSKYWGGGIPR